MNSKLAKKMRRLSKLIGNGKPQDQIEIIYKNMKSAYKTKKATTN